MILIDKFISQYDFLHRNFHQEGKYIWEITPYLNDVKGRTKKSFFEVEHSKLEFIGDVGTNIFINGEYDLDVQYIDHSKGNSMIQWPFESDDISKKFLVEISKEPEFKKILKAFFLITINLSGMLIFLVFIFLE